MIRPIPFSLAGGHDRSVPPSRDRPARAKLGPNSTEERKWIERLGRLGFVYFRPMVVAALLLDSSTGEEHVAHAAKATKRLVERRRHLHGRNKKPVVANCATARELACWMWAIGCMCEGTM